MKEVYLAVILMFASLFSAFYVVGASLSVLSSPEAVRTFGGADWHGGGATGLEMGPSTATFLGE